MSPANAPNRRTGANWHAVSSPTATPLPVRCRTSRVWVISVSQLPICEIPWPRKNRRKLRIRSELNVSFEKRLSAFMAPRAAVPR